jgi:hypothetical protein
VSIFSGEVHDHFPLPLTDVCHQEKVFFAKRAQSCSMFTRVFEKIEGGLQSFQSQKNPSRTSKLQKNPDLELLSDLFKEFTLPRAILTRKCETPGDGG